MSRTIEELNDAYFRIETQISDVSVQLSILTASVTQLSDGVKSVTELMKQQVHLSSELTHLRKAFEQHEKDAEKILINIEKDLDAIRCKQVDADKELKRLEMDLHDNTNARKVGQWVGGLVIAAGISWVTWRLK